MNKKIVFTNVHGADEQHYPRPAEILLPNWYKKTESYIGKKKKPSGDSNTTATVKRCMPVFDAITSGYILFTWTDVFVQQKLNDNGTTDPHYYYPSFHPISFHPINNSPP